MQRVELSHRSLRGAGRVISQIVMCNHRVISQKIMATYWVNKRLTTAGFQVPIIALVRYIIIIFIVIIIISIIDTDPSDCAI